MNFNYNADMKYARIVAEKANLGLVIRDDITMPYTDFSSIFIPPLDPEWAKSSMEYKNWWYIVLHECYHNLHPDDFVMLKKQNVDTKSFLGTVWNIVIDFKIETINRGEFLGRDNHVKDARYAFATDKIYGLFDRTSDAGGRSDKLHAVWVLDALCRIPWIPQYHDDDLARLLSPEAQGYLEKLLSSPTLSTNYSNQKTAQDSYNVACEILKILGDDPNAKENRGNPKPKPGDEKSEGKGEADGAEGDKGGEGRGEEVGGNSGQDAESDKEAWVKFSDVVADAHEVSGDRETGLHIEYDMPINRPYAWVPKPIEEIDLDQIDGARKNRAKLSDMCNNQHLTKKIRRELQAKLVNRWDTNKKRGRLHKRNIHKVHNGGDKVFKKRAERIHTKGTVVGVLTDFSGSMNGNKYYHACTASHELTRVLSSLHIITGVYGFSTTNSKLNKLLPLKKFNESFRSDVFQNRCIAGGDMMHSNADGDFLLWMGEKLMKQKAQRRILFVLSDGQPAALDNFGNRDIDAFTHSVVKNMLASRAIEVYGIGIEDSSVEHFYPAHCVIKESSELEEKLLTVLRNKIINHM